MLKIIDDFDLEKLKDYGFEITYKDRFRSNDTYSNQKEYRTDEDNELFDNFNIQLIVNPHKAKIKNQLIGCFNAKEDEIDEAFDLDLLYDLIKDGIVEKVSDEDE